MAATPEAKVKAKIRQILTARGAYFITVMGTAYGRSGSCDIPACYKGKFIGIEAKALPTSNVTPLQMASLEAIMKAGGFALVIHSKNYNDLIDTLDEIDLNVR